MLIDYLPLDTLTYGQAEKVEHIQSLWSNYGAIERYRLTDCEIESVILKHVKVPKEISHPRGWNTPLSHTRKIKSYRVECEWYQNYSRFCDDKCRLPICYGTKVQEDEYLIVMEDLDSKGFPVRKIHASLSEIEACIDWLANFHARFLNQSPTGLWPEGSYWHLSTRPDELEALQDDSLKQCAQKIDSLLRNCTYQTIVHGDAKLANFCFSAQGNKVAAVDFQYVGGGCGMKDLAYFIGSCLTEKECFSLENSLLDFYFNCFKGALAKQTSTIDPIKIEEEWRPLFKYAWTDFHRFLKGWSPGHWKIHGYSERLAKQVISELNGR